MTIHAHDIGDNPHRILFLSSYHPGFPTFFKQVEGIKSVFNGVPVHLDIEFMDSKRFPSQENLENFYQSLSMKLAKTEPYDVIITGDDNALIFVVEYQEQLFQGQPIVFFGVNNKTLAFEQNKNPKITGVVEAVSMQETLQTMVNLHSDAKEIVAIVDGTPSGQGDLVTYYQYKEVLSPVILSDLSLQTLTFDELATKLKNLSDDKIVLLISAYHDKNEASLSFDNSLEFIKKNLSRPLYHLWEHGLGDGVLGGKIISHYHQGKAAGELVQLILSGRPVEKIAVRNDSPNSYYFDYNEMQNFGIEFNDLPPDSVVLNRPQSFYREHKLIVWIYAIILLVFSVMTVIMWVRLVQRREIEDVLRESSQSKSEFINTLAHEFRTPLTTLQGYSELLLKNNDLSDKEKIESINYIYEKTIILSSLVDDVLDVARIESSNNFCINKSINTVEEIFKKLRPFLKLDNKRKIKIDLQDNRTRLNVDADKLEQVFLNLLTNSIKFSRDKSTIEISGALYNDFYRFSIIDQGIGMSSEQVDKVFDKYYRADASDKAVSGIGLGMHIAKQIVEAHDGNIYVESKLGQGTTAHIVLPVFN